MAQQGEENKLTGSSVDVAGVIPSQPSGAGQGARSQKQAQSLPLAQTGAASGHMPLRSTRRDILLCVVLGLACLALYLLPTGFENRLPDNAVRCRATVLSVDNERVHQ